MNPPRFRLSLHHIGGRFGNGGFPVIPAFEQDIVRVYYDADTDCIDNIRDMLAGSAAAVHVLPYCLGEAHDGATLHINYDTTSSSLYPLNRDYAQFYFFSYNHDFVAEDSLKTMEKREIKVDSLDGLQEIRTGVVPPPDFLSMDVQGAEYSVLKGACSLLRNNVLGLVIETGLHPLYEGQRLFGDVQQLLAGEGYYFVTFLGFHDYAPFRAPTGLRGDGFHVLADALFLRRADHLEKVATGPVELGTMLMKLAFIAIVYGQMEYGLLCLQQCADLGGAIDDHAVKYPAFLRELVDAAAAMPTKYPKTFSEKYTYELSKKRFMSKRSLGAASDGSSSGLAERLWLGLVYPNIYRIAGVYDFIVRKVWAGAASMLLPNSPVEKILKKYGLPEQAGTIKKNRVVQTLFSRQRARDVEKI